MGEAIRGPFRVKRDDVMRSASEMLYTDDCDIEAVLRHDAAGAALREMLDALSQRRADVKRILDKGVTPVDFARGRALLGSYDAALKGLEQAWDKRHKRA